jgi:2-succinyl-5-enolpyruvyl-6-hydroxy-3-cyclohexene-1-carboxylate synthase
MGTSVQAEINRLAAKAFVQSLIAAGIENVCITPGSRSAPLTIQFAEQNTIKPWLHLDERSSAFFALGLAKKTKRPVVLLCTSGTAAANYLPAIVEADLSRIPLIVCTTDRPPRLRNVGAPQTIDQVGLYAKFVRSEIDLTPPMHDNGATSTNDFKNAANRAVHDSLGPLPGPVHINIPFEEPLTEKPNEQMRLLTEPVSIQTTQALANPSSKKENQLAAQALYASKKPLIVVGPTEGNLPIDALCKLSDIVDAPILADPLSLMRTGKHDLSKIIDTYDTFLRDPRSKMIEPDCILRLGAIPTSKILTQFLTQLKNKPETTQILCDLPGSWRDPFASANMALVGDPTSSIEGILGELTGKDNTNDEWIKNWQNLNRSTRNAIDAQVKNFTETFEGRTVIELQNLLPNESVLFAGNSMPIREVDTFSTQNIKKLNVVANRGANGIDGVIATALGYSAASEPIVTLLIGDLSFAHDLSSLWAAKEHNLNLTIVLLNNYGGGIFHYLPVREQEHVFEDWFATPSNLNFKAATELYDGNHTVIRNWDHFKEAIQDWEPGLRVLELQSDRELNKSMHDELWKTACSVAWSEL